MSARLLVILAVVVVGTGCRVLALDKSVPCNDAATDCPLAGDTCEDHRCVSHRGGEGDAGEGEGEAGEGEGDVTDVFDFIAGDDTAIDDDIAGALLFSLRAEACTGADCVQAPGAPGGRPQATQLAPDPTPRAGIQTLFLVEAVVQLDGQAGNLFRIEGDTGAVVSADVQPVGGTPNAQEIQMTLGDVVVSRLIGKEMRGWVHLFCGVNGTASSSLDLAGCFMNGERFGAAPSGTGVPASNGTTSVTIGKAYEALTVWGADDYLSVVGVDVDPLVHQARLQAFADARLAAWAGVVVPTGQGPIFHSPREVDVGKGRAGSAALLVGGATPVLWLTPGWPRVTGGGLLLEPAHQNDLSAGDVVAGGVASGCAEAPGPGGTPQEGLRCGAASDFDVAVKPAQEARVASLFARDEGQDGFVQLGTCPFTLATAQSGACRNADVGGGWRRLSATLDAGVDTLHIGTNGTVVIALVQVEVGSVPSTPLFAGTRADADVIRFSFAAPEGAVGLEMFARFDSHGTEGPIVVGGVTSAGVPAVDARVLLAGGAVSMEDGGGASVDEAVADASAYDATFGMAPTLCDAACEGLHTDAPFAGGAVDLVVIGGDLPGAGEAALPGRNTAVVLRALSIRGTGIATEATPPRTVVVQPNAPGALDAGALAELLVLDVRDAAVPEDFAAECNSAGAPDLGATAPLEPQNAAFHPDATCHDVIGTNVQSFGADALVVDALFEVVPGADPQRVAGFQERKLAVDVVDGGGAAQLRFSDDGLAWRVRPSESNAAGWDGWVYLVCAHTPGSDPVCSVNMGETDVVDDNDAPDDFNRAAEFGDDEADEARDLGAIAVVGVYRNDTGAAERGLVLARAAHFFDIDTVEGSLPTPPQFSRKSTAMVAVRSGGIERLLPVARHWPRVAQTSTARPAGYIAEGSAVNRLLGTTDMGASPWVPSGATALDTGADGPRPSAEIIAMGAGARTTQPVPSTSLEGDAPVNGQGEVPVTFSAYVLGGNAELTLRDAADSNDVIAHGASACFLQPNCAFIQVDDNPFGWHRIAVDGFVSVEPPVTMDADIKNSSDTDTLFVVAPQLEVGHIATSYIPVGAVAGTRDADRLAYDIDGPVAFAGSLVVHAHLPAGNVRGEAVLASFIGSSGPPQLIHYLQNAPALVSWPVALDELIDLNHNHITFSDATLDVEVTAEWRGSASRFVAGNGTTEGSIAEEAHPAIDAVPMKTLRVGGVDNSPDLKCGACQAGIAVDDIELTLTPGVP